MNFELLKGLLLFICLTCVFAKPNLHCLLNDSPLKSDYPSAIRSWFWVNSGQLGRFWTSWSNCLSWKLSTPKLSFEVQFVTFSVLGVWSWIFLFRLNFYVSTCWFTLLNGGIIAFLLWCSNSVLWTNTINSHSWADWRKLSSTFR